MSSTGGPQQLANGRWISNGRQAALSCLDSLVGERANIQRLAKELQLEFDKNPVKFFKEMVMPLMPKAMLMPGDQDQDAETKAMLLRQALAQMELATAPAFPPSPINTPVSTEPASRM